MDLLDVNNINNVIRDIQPDEVYNLAAQSFVGTSFNQPLVTSDIDAM
jgi:GDPmannose 4,6-dehydratase